MEPRIPLGTNAQFKGKEWQVVGYQHRLGTEPDDPDDACDVPAVGYTERAAETAPTDELDDADAQASEGSTRRMCVGVAQTLCRRTDAPVCGASSIFPCPA